MSLSPFWTLHRDLPREGPGEPADVAWAMDVAGVRPDARIADLACGPGADIVALLVGAPGGHVTAQDKTDHFVSAVQDRFGADPRVDVALRDMRDVEGPFDFIWCAGAAYIVGVVEALTDWKPALPPQGAVAFSEPCLFGEASEETLRFWSGYPVRDAAGIKTWIAEAGYEVIGTRRLSDAAWENYYGPADARIAMLRDGADADLADYLNEAEEEAEGWRKLRRETGYLLSVVRPR